MYLFLCDISLPKLMCFKQSEHFLFSSKVHMCELYFLNIYIENHALFLSETSYLTNFNLSFTQYSNTFYFQVNDLKRELEARNLSAKGLKSQLVARLTNALKNECEKESGDKQGDLDADKKAEDADESIDDEKKKDKVFKKFFLKLLY